MAHAILRNAALLEGAEKVEIYERYGDWGAREAHKTAKVKDGEVLVSDLEDGRSYVARSDRGHVTTFTAKAPPEEKARRDLKDIQADLALTRHEPTEVPLEDQYPAQQLKALLAKSADPAPQPRLSQADVRGEPQRSATPLGTAELTDPEESQPFARQEDVGDEQPQRSSTKTGMATLISEQELAKDAVPFPRQEDEDGPQMSFTKTGQAVPVPTSREQAIAQAKRGSEQNAQLAKDGGEDVKAQDKQAKAQDKQAKAQDKDEQAGARQQAKASEKQGKASEKQGKDAERHGRRSSR